MILRPGIRVQVGIFSLLFAGGMWMSKVAQPMYFEDRGALVAFGVGYAVMALVGGLSFAWGALADRMGGRNAVLVGTSVYAVGIAGRLLTDLSATIAFSALAGAGASLALTGIRPWVRSQVPDAQISTVVAGRNLGNQVGVFVGTLGAALLFAAVAGSGNGPAVAVGLAPALVVASVVWLLVSGGPSARTKESPLVDGTTGVARWRSLSMRLAIIGILSGFYVSLITPYLPLFLIRSGLPESGAAVVIAVMSAAQIAVTAILAKRGTAPRPFGTFFFAEIAAGVITVVIGLALGAGPVLLAALFIARAGFVALAATTEETIQYAVIPGSAAGFVFGIAQTAFLLGDALGGAIGAPLWGNLGPHALALIAGGATLLNAFLLPVLLRGRRSADAEVVRVS